VDVKICICGAKWVAVRCLHCGSILKNGHTNMADTKIGKRTAIKTMILLSEYLVSLLYSQSVALYDANIFHSWKTLEFATPSKIQVLHALKYLDLLKH
jgi:phosphatidylglycerophosphate synthase